MAIDVYFDNVGGEALAAALSALRVHGRIIACGRHLRLQRGKPRPGPANLFNMITQRLTMKVSLSLIGWSVRANLNRKWAAISAPAN